MKERYMNPEMEIMCFEGQDVITNSTEELPATLSVEEIDNW